MPDDWDEYRRLILAAIERVDLNQLRLEGKFDLFQQQDVANLKVDVAMLKVRAGIIGAVAGLVGGAVVAAVVAKVFG